MKALLINGSPNEKGCTYMALSEVAATLEENGVETKIVPIGKQPIRGCIGCGGCAGKNRCVFNEDPVNALIEEMETADALVIGCCQQIGGLHHRLHVIPSDSPLHHFYAGGCFAHKPAAAVASARRAGTTVTLDDLNKYFQIRQMPVVSSTYWNMVHGSRPEEVQKDEEGLQTMRNLGRNMAWLLKCIEKGRKDGLEPPVNEHTYKTNFIR